VANAALRDALPKEDRHLRIAPRFFDRDETPAIRNVAPFFDQSEVVRHVARMYYRRRRAAWPFAAVNLPVYCDISLRRFKEVVPVAGSGNAALRIATERLDELTSAIWVDVCR